MTLRDRRAATALVLAAVPLGSCALNQVRVEDADIVQKAASTATVGATVFLRTVDRAREDTTVALVVADPACGVPQPQIRTLPDLDSAHPSLGALCAARPVGEERRLSTEPLGPELALTLLLVHALGAYGAALAAASDDARAETVTAPLLDALSIARSVDITLHGGGEVPSPSDPRVVAADSLVTLLDGLAREAATVGRLRKALAAQQGGVGRILDPLERQIRSWERARDGDAGLRILASGWAASRVVARRPPGPPDERRTALTEFYATRDTMADEARLAPALLAALHAVRDADADLRRVLAPHPDLTSAERRRIAELSRQRLVTAFGRVAALASAIRGGMR